jgi:hypothetical protein
VIGHQTVSQQADWRTAHRCNHNPLERGVIFGLVKKLAAPIGAVKSVVNYLPGAMRARLGMSNAYIDLRYLQGKGSRPLFPVSTIASDADQKVSNEPFE